MKPQSYLYRVPLIGPEWVNWYAVATSESQAVAIAMAGVRQASPKGKWTHGRPELIRPAVVGE